MFAEAMAEGILNAATPIAAADAATYKQMIFQNLSNNQQANITNAKAYLQMDMANLSNTQQANMMRAQQEQQRLQAGTPRAAPNLDARRVTPGRRPWPARRSPSRASTPASPCRCGS